MARKRISIMRYAQWAIGFCLALAALPLAAADLDPNAVAAKVGDEVISVRQCEREVKRIAPQLPSDPAALQSLRRSALQACIDRAAALQQLTAQKEAATEADVEQMIGRLQKQLAARDITWEQHVAAQGLSPDEYRTEIRWGLSWDAALERHLTEENLKRVFAKSPRDFDGTRLRVAHLLLKTPAGETSAALQQAATIRQQIADKQLTFAEAAKKYSQAPTAAQGGEIGFIDRHQPMPEAFSAAAFQLAPGEVSAPVVSPAGVHLIACLEVVPGQRTFDDARDDVRAAATKILFHHLAKRGKDGVTIKISEHYVDSDSRATSSAPLLP